METIFERKKYAKNLYVSYDNKKHLIECLKDFFM